MTNTTQGLDAEDRIVVAAPVLTPVLLGQSELCLPQILQVEGQTYQCSCLHCSDCACTLKEPQPSPPRLYLAPQTEQMGPYSPLHLFPALDSCFSRIGWIWCGPEVARAQGHKATQRCWGDWARASLGTQWGRLFQVPTGLGVIKNKKQLPSFLLSPPIKSMGSLKENLKTGTFP